MTKVTLRDVDRQLATLKLRDYVKQAWGVAEPATPLLNNWHVDIICDHLQAVTEGKIQYLLINIPPGHAKSLIVSVLWPTWVWVKNSKWRSLFGSYDKDLAIRDTMKSRSVLESQWYRETFRPKWKMSIDQNQKSWYENTDRGVRMALSVSGKGTGFRGDAIVADDPLNAEDQYSDAAIEQCIRWWDQTMSSRLNNMATGSKVIIMQRLSDRDLSAHVLEQGGYEHLCLPSEFEPERRSFTSIGRDPRTEAGELLFPGLFPQGVLNRAKIDMGTSQYAGQHQQRPAPLGGNILLKKWWRYWHFQDRPMPPVLVRDEDNNVLSIDSVPLPDRFNQIVQSWDMSFKDLKTSDYVVGQVWGALRADKFLLDSVRGRMNMPASCDAVRELSKKWPDALTKLIEDKANGPAVVSQLKSEIAGLIPITPDGGKVARAQAASPQVEAGNVYLPHPSLFPWVSEFISECADFPNAVHDDYVDAATQALNRLRFESDHLLFPEFNHKTQSSIVKVLEMKEWWFRWISLSWSPLNVTAHWWCQNESGQCYIYREWVREAVSAESVGMSLAKLCDNDGTSSIVWIEPQWFEDHGRKSVAQQISEGIQRELGIGTAFVRMNTYEEAGFLDPDKRIRAMDRRQSQLRNLRVTIRPAIGDETFGWEHLRTMMRVETHDSNLKPTIDAEVIRAIMQLLDAEQRYAEYMSVVATPVKTPPGLLINPECVRTIHSLSTLLRKVKDSSSAQMDESDAVAKSLLCGSIAHSGAQRREPMEAFIARRLEKASQKTDDQARLFMVAQKAELDYGKTQVQKSYVFPLTQKRKMPVTIQ